MGEHIVLRDDPKMEFQLHEHGFAIKDARTKQNSDFYDNFLELGYDLSKVMFI